MASRRDYYYRQLVAEDDLDAGFQGLEDADRALIVDLALWGVAGELGDVTEHAGTPNLTVDISGPVVVYDKAGQRVYISSAQVKDVSVDDSAVSTSVGGGGNEKWVSLFAKFERVLSDPQVDGNSNTVYFVRDEGFSLSVVQGTEAAIGLATRPSLDGTKILLADIRRTNGQTQILNADISITRREDLFALSGSPYSTVKNSIKGAIENIQTNLNAHATSGTAHTAASITYAGGGAWRDASTNPATTVELQLDKIITDLTGQGSGSSGSEKLGSAGIVKTSFTIAVGTIFSQLTACAEAQTTQYGGGGSWAGGSSPTNPATSVEAQLDKIIADLAATSSGASGAHRLGCDARTTWLGGRTNAATTLFAAVDKIITDLNDASAGDDGAERIGAAAAGNLTAGSVRSQLNELDTEKAALADVQVFTTPGANTWNKPTGAKDVYVYAIGGGGGGGSGRRGAAGSVRAGGGGGGGGGKSYGHFQASDLGSSVTVTVGAGGAGGPVQTVDDSNGTAGTGGTATTFGSLVRGGGGSGGNAGGTAVGGGSLGGTGDFDSGLGAPASDGTAAATAGVTSAAAGSGGGGGGINSSNTNTGGAAGGNRSKSYDAGGAGTAGTSGGGVGGGGGSVTANIPNGGAGGGGGGGNASGAGGGGGAGGIYGGGGGGGGASVNGNNSGVGGAGRDGICVVISHF